MSKRDDMGGIVVIALALIVLAGLRAKQAKKVLPAGPLLGLVPGFKEAVDRVVTRMRSMGHDAVVREGLRSEARARDLAAKGTGIVNSLHRIGLAADIYSETKKWSAGPQFLADLKTIAESEGLTSGAAWDDGWHVQAVPVSEQEAARAWSPAERERHMRARFG